MDGRVSKKVYFSLIFCIVICGSISLSNGMRNMSATVSKVTEFLKWRLPSEIKPVAYKLLLHPNLETSTFSGRVAIDIIVHKEISYVAVHSKALTITKTNLEKKNFTASIPIYQTYEKPEFQQWITETETPLIPGEYTISFEFNGDLKNRIVGFYESVYTDKKTNKRRKIATSKFEPTYARQAFPCFDEPSMKANFTVQLVKPASNDYIALSNMNQIDVSSDNTVVTFAESVPMSTYLVCFIVSDFQKKEKTIGDRDISMSVYAPPNQMNKIDFALDTGVSITDFYIDYFGIDYPLPKLDMVAIPDFVSGAMEHWGLVTFRTTAIFYDENSSSRSNQLRVATVIAHELAHMWFGNLVTMAWWNDLWLNEGFASYIEYKGVNFAHPEWKILDQFLTDDLHGVMITDSTPASHPIVQTVENPDQITELFDSITYSKGASLIRMMENIVGDDIFKTAVHNYLDKHKYGNAVTDDLLTELNNLEPELGINKNIKEIMAPWTTQMGFPVINVEKISNTQYRLTQQRFFSNPDYYDTEENYKWPVLITFYTDITADITRTWLDSETESITITVPENHKWLKINKDQIGYYRVKYPEEGWKALGDALEADITGLSVSDRAQLINDVFTLAEATRINYDIALQITSYLKNENQYVPWSVASSRLTSIRNVLYYTDLNAVYTDFVRSVVEPVFNSINWEEPSTDFLENRLRSTIFAIACSIDLNVCKDQVVSMFNKWIESGEQPNPDLKETVYYHGMRHGGTEEIWRQVWRSYMTEEDDQEKLKLMESLAAIQNPTLLNEYITLAENKENVRDQDYFTCMGYISSNRIGESLVWNYVRENWLKLVDRFGINERNLGRLIPTITRRFTTETQKDEMETFFAKYPEAGAGETARAQALETVRNNIKWITSNKENIGKWLTENVNNQ